jgi:subtilisin family serine protease
VTNGYKLINTGSKAKIWIVDTGILQSHQEFRTSTGASRVSSNQDYVGSGGTDCNGHGTHCAGSAAGNNRGLAPGADIGNVRVLNCQGSGTNANVIAGFNWVSSNQKSGASNVLSASLGGGYSATSNNAIANAVKNGVIAVVAAGNENNADACNVSPASTPEAITVGAISAVNNARASFSNSGSCLTVFAPGVNIHSSYYSSATSYATLSGTSMATPLTAGAVALYVSTSTSQPVSAASVKTAITNFGSRGFVTGTLLAGTPNVIINANWN